MNKTCNLDHIFEEDVYLIFSVTKIASLNVVSDLLSPATTWVVQFEVPQKVVGILEVGADGIDFVDKILHTDDASLAKLLLNDRVVGQGNALTVDFAETTLVDKVAHILQRSITPGDVGLSNSEHVDGGLVQLDEHAVVDLAQAEKLKHLSGLGWDTVNTKGKRSKIKIQCLGKNVKHKLTLGYE